MAPLNPETQKLYDAAAGSVAPPEPSPSMAAHEAQFANTPRFVPPVPAADPVPDDAMPPTSALRHRARSQVASPEEIETVNALTKRLRDAEREAGIEVDRKEGESDRVYNLRKRAELAEAVAKARVAPPASQQAAPPAPVAPPTAFTEAEPTIEQFKDKDDPYTAWQRALYAYDRRKEVAEWQQTQATEAVKQQAAAGEARKREAYASFNTRVADFKKTTPDYETLVNSVERPVTYLLETAMVNDPDGPRFIYELAKNPALHDELFVLTDNKPVNHATVASVQRLLHARIPAAPTGSAVPQTQQPLAPRPPNPVRTAPSAHVPKAPTDTASLADHERYYGTGRRR